MVVVLSREGVVQFSTDDYCPAFFQSVPISEKVISIAFERGAIYCLTIDPQLYVYDVWSDRVYLIAANCYSFAVTANKCYYLLN